MKNTSWSWRIVSTLAITSALVLGAGFVMALLGPKGTTSAAEMTDTLQKQTAPASAATQTDQTYSVVALGDSLTKGVGDKNGKGYVGYLKDKLDADGRKVTVNNLGVSGLESPELLKTVQSAGTQAVLKDAKLILISIGGNDITHSVGDISTILTTNKFDETKLLAAQDRYTKNLDEILKLVRTSNPNAPVLVVGLYNPFEGIVEDGAKLTALLDGWNANAISIVQKYANAKIVPTADIFEWNTDRLLSGDHFHPNESGYEKMAERIKQALPKSIL
ncbi:GDSL-type esterase/lipase family protein [Tumebacillus permanentifrigoris]|uniref:Lysophospholipase L1-like esterase n=1 Tax=Tumebacillus permanentifrigoris TaxID=378543 RepID=A0A316D772_9BACL|nr:GDSL-type esterase/lipase family protein [Tumebacillus permanentifrigoris]PWK08457.1 lysophospholipase L1-like esterase [Tumebacillus permanentifrigoris]